MTEIGLHRVDLADAAKRLQVESEVGSAHGHSDQVAAAGQRPHHMAAEEPRAAINGDEGFGIAFGGHFRAHGKGSERLRGYRIASGLYRPGWG